MRIKLRDVRLSFPALFEPKAFDANQKAKYSASFILEEDDPQVDEIQEAIEAVAEDKWPGKVPRRLKTCLRNGEEKPDTAGYGDGVMFVTSSSPTQPRILDRAKRDLTEADGVPYGGSYVSAVLELWAQDNQYGRRINAELKAVVFLRHGEAFGGGSPVRDEELDDLCDGEVEDPEDDDDFLD